MALQSNLLEQNQEAVVFVSNIDQRINEDLLWELFIQAGPVMSVYIPRDKVTGDHNGYAFVEFKTELDADYAIKIMHMIKLYNRQIKLNKASTNKQTHDIGANIFIKNLSIDVDEKKLYETFQTFGPILNSKIMRDPISGISKGFGFVHYDNFQSSDMAIKKMDNQLFSGQQINVEYAYKENSKGERHGCQAERFIASNNQGLLGRFNLNEQRDFEIQLILIF